MCVLRAMDPIAAWKAQQERNGFANRERPIEELRKSSAFWAVAFDAFDEDNDGKVTSEQALNVLGRIAEGPTKSNSAEVPHHKFLELFNAIAEGGADSIDYRKFHKLTVQVTEYMVENPKWRSQEADAEQLSKETRKKERELRKNSKEPPAAVDLCSILGISKTKELKELEERKEEALARRRKSGPEPDGDKIAGASLAVLGAQRMVRRARLGLVSRHATMQDLGGAISKSGSLPALRQPQRTATIDLPTDLPQMVHQGFGSACVTLSFSVDGSKLAAGFYDGFLRIYDVDHRSQLFSLCLSDPTASNLRRRSLGDQYALTAAESLASLRPQSVPPDAPITCVRWMNVQRHNALATVDSAGFVGLWNTPFGRAPELRMKMRASEKELDCMAPSMDASRLFVAGAEKVVKVFDVEHASHNDMNLVDTFGDKWSGSQRASGHTLKILSLVVDPTSRDVFLSGGMDKRIFLWDARVGSVPVRSLLGAELAGDALDISRNGMTVLAGSHRSKGHLQLFDLRATKEVISEMLELDPVYKTTSREEARRPPRDSEKDSAEERKPGSRKGSKEALGRSCDQLQLQPVATYEWNGTLAANEALPVHNRCTTASMLFAAKWDSFNNGVIAIAGEKDNLGQVLQRPKNNALDEPLKVRAIVDGRQGVLFAAAVSDDGRTAAFGASDGSVQLCDLRQI